MLVQDRGVPSIQPEIYVKDFQKPFWLFFASLPKSGSTWIFIPVTVFLEATKTPRGNPVNHGLIKWASITCTGVHRTIRASCDGVGLHRLDAFEQGLVEPHDG